MRELDDMKQPKLAPEGGSGVSNPEENIKIYQIITLGCFIWKQ
jgi:hypothetical protein